MAALRLFYADCGFGDWRHVDTFLEVFVTLADFTWCFGPSQLGDLRGYFKQALGGSRGQEDIIALFLGLCYLDHPIFMELINAISNGACSSIG